MYTERKLNAIWLDFEKETAYMMGRNITKLTMRRKDAVWLLVVNADKGTAHEVCFIRAHTMTACLDAFLTLVNKNQVKWYADKYYRP